MGLRPLSNRDAIQSWMGHRPTLTPTLESERRSRVVGRGIDPELCDYGPATQNFQAASDATRISRMHVTCQRTSYLVFSCSERGKTRTYSLIWPAQRSLGSLFSELYSSWKRLFQIMEYEQCSSLLKQRKIDQQNAESPDVLFPKIRWSKEDNYIRAACCLYTMTVFRSVKWW